MTRGRESGYCAGMTAKLWSAAASCRTPKLRTAEQAGRQQQARKPSEGPVTAGYPAALQRAGEISGLGVLTVAGAGLISQTAQNEGSSGDIDENKEGQASGIRFQLSGAAGNVSTVAGRRFAQRAIDHSRRFRALLTASWVAESSLTPR